MPEKETFRERITPHLFASQELLYARMHRLAESRDALIPKYKARTEEGFLRKAFREVFGDSADDVYDEMERFEKKIEAIKRIIEKRDARISKRNGR